MSKPRVNLQLELESIMDNNPVYFQPPPTVMMKYPCIVYKLNNDKVQYANNGRYFGMNRYSATLIDKNPDSLYAEKLKKFSYCSFDRMYTADNLNHFDYIIFY